MVPRGKVVVGISFPDNTQEWLDSPNDLQHFLGKDHPLPDVQELAHREQVVINAGYLWKMWKKMMHEAARLVEGNPHHPDFDSDRYDWIKGGGENAIENWKEKFGRISVERSRLQKKIEHRAARPEF